MEHILGKRFNFFSLIGFAVPSMVMMLITGLYTIVDSIFVARFVGTNALSSVNIVFPAMNTLLAVAIMLATGGSAIVARQMGAGHTDSNKTFTLITLTGVIASIILAIMGLIWIEPLIYGLGASPLLYDNCLRYLGIILLFAPFVMLQLLFQTFFVTAGKPALGMFFSILAGAVNAALDYLFIVHYGLGVSGAAIATGIGYTIPSLFGVIFFMRKNEVLHFVKPQFNFHALKECCINGSSEMVTNLAMGVTTLLFNLMMMRYIGENGVAAITIILYAQFLLDAIIIGFSMGVAPIISYNFGAKNTAQLSRTFKYCLLFVGIIALCTVSISLLGASSLIMIFAPKGSPVYQLALEGFAIFGISFLFTGFNIYASALFTALSNGRVSAIISFMRTFLFTTVGLVVLPLLFGINGIWLAVPVAEGLSILVSGWFILRYRKQYHYLPLKVAIAQ